MDINVTVDPSNLNHIKYDYSAEDIFLDFPSKFRTKTFVNGTASERTILKGTLVGLTTADQTIAAPVAATVANGAEVPLFVVPYDIVIPAGALEEVEALVAENGSIFEDKVVLEGAGGTETLDTVITALASIVIGQSIRNALLNANSNIKLEPAAQDISDYKDAQV